MPPSQNISIPVSPELYKQFRSRARREKKTLAELGRELLIPSLLSAGATLQPEPTWAKDLRLKLDELQSELKTRHDRETVGVELDAPKSRFAPRREAKKQEPRQETTPKDNDDAEWHLIDRVIEAELNDVDWMPPPLDFDDDDEAKENLRPNYAMPPFFEQVEESAGLEDEPHEEFMGAWGASSLLAGTEQQQPEEAPLIPVPMADIVQIESELNQLLQESITLANESPSSSIEPQAVPARTPTRATRPWPLIDKLKRLFIA